MTSDGDYIASGTTKSFGSGKDFNAWLVKILDYDNQRPNKPDTSEEKQNGKPGTNYTYTSSCLEPGREVLFYIWDRGIRIIHIGLVLRILMNNRKQRIRGGTKANMRSG